MEAEFLADLCASPELFPHGLDPSGDSVSFIRLHRADYAAASFLDARILTAKTARHVVPWREASAAIEAAGLRESCSYIFHIGHCGSTLLSRLIGAHAGIFALREPMVLRTLTQLAGEPQMRPPGWELETHLAGCLKLLSRTFEAGETAVVKATSFVSELAGKLLQRAAAPRAVLMFLAPEAFLATILAGPNSRQEARMLAPWRLERLQRRIGGPALRPETLTEGEAIALGWACEMSALAQAARVAGARAFCVDFDRFLARPTAGLDAALRHFGVPAVAGEVEALVAGPEMQRYSKAPEHVYDAALRQAVLNSARAAQGTEIRRGLLWLERAAEQFVPVRDALELALSAG